MGSLDLSGVPVLVVDDHEPDVEIFAYILTFHGAIVQRATTVLDAITNFERQPPRVVITDLAMPNGSGWDLLHEVRRRDATVPVMVITAQFLPGTGWLIAEGFDAVLYKPVDPAELVALVAHLAPPR
jgi:CheY-like chemotaxis protein